MEFLKEVIFAIAGGSGFAALDWKTVVMLVIACVLLYMGIGKGFEPLLLVPIAFGMLLVNIYPDIIAPIGADPLPACLPSPSMMPLPIVEQ